MYTLDIYIYKYIKYVKGNPNVGKYGMCECHAFTDLLELGSSLSFVSFPKYSGSSSQETPEACSSWPSEKSPGHSIPLCKHSQREERKGNLHFQH